MYMGELSALSVGLSCPDRYNLWHKLESKFWTIAFECSEVYGSYRMDLIFSVMQKLFLAEYLDVILEM
jgi:hypothetical protein